jgi:HAE1 family hydrophobic/amphiphilic exporter-1
MGTLFESTILPLSVLFSIPYACGGGLCMLLVTGTPLDVNGMVGFVLLAGIVVNNAIVLIDHINKLQQEGLTRIEAILRGSRERLRPILMTAMTTIFGLLPMAMPSVFSSGGQSSVFTYRSLATVVLGGLLLSTLSTMFVVPLFYTFFDDLRNKYRALGAFLFSKAGQSPDISESMTVPDSPS